MSPWIQSRRMVGSHLQFVLLHIILTPLQSDSGVPSTVRSPQYHSDSSPGAWWGHTCSSWACRTQFLQVLPRIGGSRPHCRSPGSSTAGMALTTPQSRGTAGTMTQRWTAGILVNCYHTGELLAHMWTAGILVNLNHTGELLAHRSTLPALLINGEHWTRNMWCYGVNYGTDHIYGAYHKLLCWQNFNVKMQGYKVNSPCYLYFEKCILVKYFFCLSYDHLLWPICVSHTIEREWYSSAWEKEPCASATP